MLSSCILRLKLLRQTLGESMLFHFVSPYHCPGGQLHTHQLILRFPPFFAAIPSFLSPLECNYRHSKVGFRRGEARDGRRRGEGWKMAEHKKGGKRKFFFSLCCAIFSPQLWILAPLSLPPSFLPERPFSSLSLSLSLSSLSLSLSRLFLSLNPL